MPTCGRCKKPVTELEAEYCWFCMGFLCYECWDKYGHCGHAEAVKENNRIKKLLESEEP